MPIIGTLVEIVTSSWIDMLGGLSQCHTLSVPPGVCAAADNAHDAASSRMAATAAIGLIRRMRPCPPLFLPGWIFLPYRFPSFVEPDVLHSVAVVDAVDHRRQALDVSLRAGAAARVEDNRPRALLGQPPFDLPHQLLALVGIGLGRLLVDQFVDLGIAVAGIVPHRAAHEVLVELLVGIVDAA